MQLLWCEIDNKRLDYVPEIHVFYGTKNSNTKIENFASIPEDCNTPVCIH